jgi:hypothetical protein
MDEVRKPINFVCYTPSSEPYRIYLQKQFNTTSLLCIHFMCIVRITHDSLCEGRIPLQLMNVGLICPFTHNISRVDSCQEESAR